MWLSSLLLDLAECLMEVEGARAGTARVTGQILLEQLFRWQPHARGQVLARLFAGLGARFTRFTCFTRCTSARIGHILTQERLCSGSTRCRTVHKRLSAVLALLALLGPQYTY